MARRSSGAADIKAKPQPSGRKTTRQVAAHFPEEVAWQLRELAAERRTTIQALIAEALDGLFQKYGKPEIAQGEKGGAT
jgi:Antitoxin-like ribbon-helix-helix